MLTNTNNCSNEVKTVTNIITVFRVRPYGSLSESDDDVAHAFFLFALSLLIRRLLSVCLFNPYCDCHVIYLISRG